MLMLVLNVTVVLAHRLCPCCEKKETFIYPMVLKLRKSRTTALAVITVKVRSAGGGRGGTAEEKAVMPPPPPRWLLTPFTGRWINNLRKCSFIAMAFRQLARAWSCQLHSPSIFLKMNMWKNGGPISWPLHLYSTLFFNPGALKLSVSAHSEVLIGKKERKKEKVNVVLK